MAASSRLECVLLFVPYRMRPSNMHSITEHNTVCKSALHKIFLKVTPKCLEIQFSRSVCAMCPFLQCSRRCDIVSLTLHMSQRPVGCNLRLFSLSFKFTWPNLNLVN